MAAVNGYAVFDRIWTSPEFRRQGLGSLAHPAAALPILFGAGVLGAYLAYALRILHNVGLPCEGITTPGGFGSKAVASPALVIPALLAKKANAPVMMRVTREEEHYIGRARTGMVGRAPSGMTLAILTSAEARSRAT